MYHAAAGPGGGSSYYAPCFITAPPPPPPPRSRVKAPAASTAGDTTDASSVDDCSRLPAPAPLRPQQQQQQQVRRRRLRATPVGLPGRERPAVSLSGEGPLAGLALPAPVHPQAAPFPCPFPCRSPPPPPCLRFSPLCTPLARCLPYAPAQSRADEACAGSTGRLLPQQQQQQHGGSGGLSSCSSADVEQQAALGRVRQAHDKGSRKRMEALGPPSGWVMLRPPKPSL